MKRKLPLLFLPLLLLSSCQKTSSSPSPSSLSSSPSESLTSSSSLSGSVSDALHYAQSQPLTLSGDCTLLIEESETPYAHYELGFDESAISVRQDLYSTDGTLVEGKETIYFAKENGKTYSRTINLKNEVEDIPLLSSGESVPFHENFPNPFSILTFSDILHYEDTYLIKPKKISDFTLYALHQSVSPTKVSLTMEDGTFTKMSVETSSSSGLGGVFLSYRYDFTIEYGTEIEIPSLSPFVHEEGHDLLKEKLLELHQKVQERNYTIQMHYEPEEGISDFSYYVTDKGELDSSTDSTGQLFGLLRQHDGYHLFSYLDGAIRIDEETVYEEEEIALDLHSFAPELFFVEEDRYLLREDYASELSQLVVPFLYRDYVSAYASAMEIVLDSRQVEKITIDIVDADNLITGTLTMSFSDFGTTSWPITI